MVAYVGNGPYCYANATAMLLETAGESIPPATIEVLTAVGLGAFLVKGPDLLFFSNVSTAPDHGIGRAMRILGFEYKERASERADAPPFDELRSDMERSPAILGPLDMGYLTYNPSHEFLAGADHFVLAYGMDNASVFLHDPEGFPHATISRADLENAWRADRIAYRRGHYRYWTDPRRVREPTEDGLYAQAVEAFREVYRKEEPWAAKGWRVGRDAIEASAQALLAGAPTEEQVAHLVFFAFKLGARRAIDFARFLREGDRGLAELKARQAELFGLCHTLAVDHRWAELARALAELGDVEDSFRATLLSDGS